MDEVGSNTTATTTDATFHALDKMLTSLEKGEEKKVDKTKKTNYSILLEYREQCKAELASILSLYFNDNYDIVDYHDNTPSLALIKSFENWLNSLSLSNGNRDEFFNSIMRDRRYSDYHYNILVSSAIIHFPQLTVKNSRKRSHIMRDMYIKFDFNFIYRMIDFRGYRLRKTYSEYASNYNFSHLPSSAGCDRGGHFCLGSTEYSDAYTALYHKYDADRLSLFIQQLPDYLSWESLEGGPYNSMSNIGNRDYNISNRRYVTNTELNNIYKIFIQKYEKNIPISIVDNGSFLSFDVIDNEEFKTMCTSVCPDSLKMNYDTITKKEYVNSELGTSSHIANINKQYENTKVLNYKGQGLYFKIIDPNEGLIEEKPNVIKIAPPELVNYIKNQIKQGINTFYIKQFIKEHNLG